MTDLPPQPDPARLSARLAADWATILQSEAAALAVDREVHEALQRAAVHLAQQAVSLGASVHDAARCTPADAAPGTPAVDDAPVARVPCPDAKRDRPEREPAGLG